jgi:uncharacterized protein YjdB
MFLPTEEASATPLGDARRITRYILAGILLTSCSGDSTGPRQAVESVDVVPPVATVSVGGSFVLEAEARTADGTLLAGRAAHWSVADPSIATVDGEGRVTALKLGVVQVAASIEGRSGLSTVTVTLIPVASVTITPANATLDVGDSARFTAVARDENGAPLSGRPIRWTSSSPVVATVSSSGMVTALSSGASIIKAESEGKSALASINVAARPVASVHITPSMDTVLAGQSVQLLATLLDDSGDPLAGKAVQWSSSNTSIASVSATGSVTGVSPGVVTVTATSEGKSGTAGVRVLASGPASITINPSSATVAVGDRLQLTAKDQNGQTLPASDLTWSSTDTRIATVNGNGRVTARFPGTVTISASTGGVTGTATITVTLLDDDGAAGMSQVQPW